MLSMCIRSLDKISNFKGQIYVCSNVKLLHTLPDVIYLLDEDIEVRYKSENDIVERGWYVQQFNKLLQTVTSDKYLVIDADTILTKELSINEMDFFVDKGTNPYHRITDQFGIGKIRTNYVTELMLFDRSIVHEMITEFFGSVPGMFSYVEEMLNHKVLFSEFQIYGSYCEVKKTINKRFLNQKRYLQIDTYTTEFVEEEVSKHKDEYDTIAFNIRKYILR